MTDHDAPTAQLPPEPPPPPAREPRKLRRSADDKVLFGVAGGLARHLDVDPVLVRVGFAVLALLGGAGVLLYVVLALVMPGGLGIREGTFAFLLSPQIAVRPIVLSSALIRLAGVLMALTLFLVVRAVPPRSE